MSRSREKVKESLFGNYEQVKKISSCEHDFQERKAILFDYIEVNFQCTKCKTWKY